MVGVGGSTPFLARLLEVHTTRRATQVGQAKGDMSLTDENPTFGTAERNGELRKSGEWLQTVGSALGDVGRLLRTIGKFAPGFRVLGFEF